MLFLNKKQFTSNPIQKVHALYKYPFINFGDYCYASYEETPDYYQCDGQLNKPIRLALYVTSYTAKVRPHKVAGVINHFDQVTMSRTTLHGQAEVLDML